MVKILAITNNQKEMGTILESLDVITSLEQTNSTTILLEGVLTGKIKQNISLSFYICGKIISAVNYSNDKINIPVHEVITNNGYSILTVHYNDNDIKTTNRIILNICLKVKGDIDNINNISATFYVGAAEFSKDLIRDHVWDNLVPIETLRFWLFYPENRQVTFSEPHATPGKLNEQQKFVDLLKLDRQNDIQVISWEKQRLSMARPFSVTAKFEINDNNKTYYRQGGNQESSSKIEELYTRYKNIEMAIKEMQQYVYGIKAKQNKLTWMGIGLLIIFAIAFIALIHHVNLLNK